MKIYFNFDEKIGFYRSIDLERFARIAGGDIIANEPVYTAIAICSNNRFNAFTGVRSFVDSDRIRALSKDGRIIIYVGNIDFDYRLKNMQCFLSLLDYFVLTYHCRLGRHPFVGRRNFQIVSRRPFDVERIGNENRAFRRIQREIAVGVALRDSKRHVAVRRAVGIRCRQRDDRLTDEAIFRNGDRLENRKDRRIVVYIRDGYGDLTNKNVQTLNSTRTALLTCAVADCLVKEFPAPFWSSARTVNVWLCDVS